MLQHRIVPLVRRNASLLALVFFSGALYLLILLCAVVNREADVDENAFSAVLRRPILGNASWAPDATVHWSSRLVRGRRATGAEVIVVYVNTDYPASVILGNRLVDIIRAHHFMGCDTMFYAITPAHYAAGTPWPLPAEYVRAAITINVSSLGTDAVCIDTYGANGLQANLDLVTVLANYAKSYYLQPDFLCQSGIPPSARRTNLMHLFAAVLTGVIAGSHPQGWHQLRLQSINTVAISSPPWSEANVGDNRYRYYYLHVLEQSMRSLSNLEERMHHSASVWIPLSTWRYVEYDTAQFVIFLCVASLAASLMGLDSRGNLWKISRGVALLWVLPCVASHVLQANGVKGFTTLCAVASVAFTVADGNAVVLVVNVVVLTMMVVLQPSMGILGGIAGTAQLLFLNTHPYVALTAPLGIGVAWLPGYLFVFYFGLQNPYGGGFSNMFTLWVILPNAVWVTSRSLRTLYESVSPRKSCTRS